MRTAPRSRPATSKDKAEFATGLMIGKYHSYCMMLLDTCCLGMGGITDGICHLKSFFSIIVDSICMFKALCRLAGATEEQMASQMRKEQYKQELLEQIAEQQRNKIR